MIVAAIGAIGTLVAENKNITRCYWLVCLLIAGSCVAVCSELVLPQILFGLKVWLPFVVGFLAVETLITKGPHDLKRPMILWAILCAGVFVNHFYRFPWVGLDVQVGDITVSGNREWTAGGIDRLSGFSRSSYDAATLILLPYIYLVMKFKAASVRALLIAVSGAAIALTTTKGAFLAFLCTLVLMPTLRLITKVRDAVERTLVAAFSLIALAGFIVPLISLRLPIPDLRQGTVQQWILGSFVDRAWNTWPAAFSLLSSWQVIVGRGIGGIGVAQDNYEPASFNPGDNFFVYLYATAGFVGFLIYAFCAQSIRYLSFDNRDHQIVFVLLFCLYVYGMTTNLLESAVLALAIGALMSFMLSLGRANRCRRVLPARTLDVTSSSCRA